MKNPFLTLIFMIFSGFITSIQAQDTYEPTWESLKKHDTPQWLKDAKFGIYTHWGIYCYSATNGNAT